MNAFKQDFVIRKTDESAAALAEVKVGTSDTFYISYWYPTRACPRCITVWKSQGAGNTSNSSEPKSVLISFSRKKETTTSWNKVFCFVSVFFNTLSRRFNVSMSWMKWPFWYNSSKSKNHEILIHYNLLNMYWTFTQIKHSGWSPEDPKIKKSKPGTQGTSLFQQIKGNQ